MDLLVLRRLTRELDARLRGVRIKQVYAVPKDHAALVLGLPGSPRLWFCAEPEQPHLYERPGQHATPKKPPAFAMAARKLLNGRRIEALAWIRGDRIVELRCAGDTSARVVFELVPRRSTAMIVDADDEVRAVWHPRRGRPRLAERYEALLADRRAPLEDLGEADLAALQACPDAETLARDLLRRVAGMSLLVARETATRHFAGMPLPVAAERELARAEEEPTAARIYSPAPLDTLRSLPGAKRFFLSPYTLRHAEDPEEGRGLHVTPFASLREAAATYFPLRARLRALALAHDDLESALSVAAARTRRTLDAVSGDSEGLGDAEAHRHMGDLLLAHPDAPRAADVATVPDDYADGRPVNIPIDPSSSLIDNAQRYYRKARRAERSRDRTAARRHLLRERLETLERLRGEARHTDDPAACRKLARRAERLGARTRPERWAAPEAPGRVERSHAFSRDGDRTTAPETDASSLRSTGVSRESAVQKRPSGAGIRIFVASDGTEILVGRNAAANDRLTHKMAGPHDFWLHAEGPGSHVVVRNPQRLEHPGATTLREAASLAAHFSFARGATKVNVRWTQIRHLRKPRGGPKGQVILRAAQTVLAEPMSPKELFGR